MSNTPFESAPDDTRQQTAEACRISGRRVSEARESRRQMICFTLFISIFYVVGFIALGYSLVSARRSMMAANWPTVPGTIAQLSLVEKTDEGTSYEVKVKYAYTVDGVAYKGDRVAFGYTSSSGYNAHEEIHRKLKSAKTVAVRYHAADPSMSCLSFGIHRSIRLGLAFSITWLAFVIGFTLMFWLFSRNDPVLLENLSVQ